MEPVLKRALQGRPALNLTGPTGLHAGHGRHGAPQRAPTVARAGMPTKGLSGNKSLIWRSWREGVVPLAVELIARDVKPSHLGIGHRHALGIAVRVKLAPHAQACPGGGCANQVHDDTVAHQRRVAPVLASSSHYGVWEGRGAI